MQITFETVNNEDGQAAGKPTPKQSSAPVIDVGKYAGKRIDQLPLSYLRWMVTQDFKEEWIEAAKKKLANSDYDATEISLTRHAMDMFSKRFIGKWLSAHWDQIEFTGLGADPLIGMDCNNVEVGIATFAARLAERAWNEGKDVSKRRYPMDGVRKELDGIVWVFQVNPEIPEYRTVVTVIAPK